MKMMIGNKSRNAIVYNFPFLSKTPYIMCLKNDTSIVQLTNKDINRLKKYCAWLCDNIIMCFLRWMSLQSNKIDIVDSLSYLNETWNKTIHKYVINKWGDKATITIHKSISSYDLNIYG